MKVVMIYFILFMFYSTLGWIMEMLVTGIPNKKFINRGFLIGPYLPIYGSGALLIIILLKPYHKDYLVLFVMSVIVCSIIEYLTNYVMEKIFKARWWDYSNMPFNINGRICLPFSIAFGILGSIIVLLNNYIYPFISTYSIISIAIIFIILLTIFITDLIVSFNIISNIELSAQNLKKDYSEEISKKVKKVLITKSKLINRLLKAFPNVKLLQKKK